jgi:RimJ/RimL family protein N-acetyltransferase
VRAPDLKPVVLEGDFVRLVPLAREHVPALHEAGRFDAIWRWNPNGPATTREAMDAYVQRALDQQAAGLGLPFATTLRETGEVVGSTRFTTVDARQPRIEIGYTWITPRWQRTRVNTEAKYLMLCHAFHAWGCARVEFRTDALNVKSRAAIVRLGAMEEGVLRHHVRCHDGRLRDSVIFGMLAAEWPEVRKRLEERLACA